MNVFTHPRVTLHLGDAYTLLESIRADALISDPQYELANGKKATTNNDTAQRGRGQISKRMKMIANDWGDSVGDRPFDPAPFLHFKTVILFGAIHYANRLPNSTAWLIWDKRENVAADDNADAELAWSNLKGPARIHRQLWKGTCRRGEENISRQGKKLHPFQKPVALMAWAIHLAKLPPNSLIFDPFMGSGATAVAALRAGHRFVGIEIVPAYFQTTLDRVQTELQPSLV